MAAVSVVGSLAVMYAPGLVEHGRYAWSPHHLNDDARQQIWPFLRHYDSPQLAGDYIASYYLACLPVGFRALYRVAAVAVDPRGASKGLPYLQLAIAVLALGAAAQRLGGVAALWGTMALALSTGLLIERLAGGLPRSFGFPLVAVGAAALVHGRPRVLAACVVLGAAFYPPAGLLLGLALAGLLLLPGDTPPARRLAALAVTAMLSGVVVAPSVLAARPYGPLIVSSHVAAFPEAGPGGRYGPDDLAEGHRLVPATVTVFARALTGADEPWWRGLASRARPFRRALLAVIAGILIAGTARLARHDAAARRLLLLAGAALLAHEASRLAAPRLFLPDRYVVYPIGVLTLVLLPAAAGALAPRRARGGAAIALTLLVLLTLGGRGPGHAGLLALEAGYDGELDALTAALRALPPEALIAGWPDGAMDDVPYLTGRRALLTWETHQAFHAAYVLEMRRRMAALVEAYWAATPEPLRRLRDEHGVTHLLVDRRHFAVPPTYFAPFAAPVRAAQRALGAAEPESLRQRGAVVYEGARFVVLDLGRLAGVAMVCDAEPTACSPPGPLRAAAAGPRGAARAARLQTRRLPSRRGSLAVCSRQPSPPPWRPCIRAATSASASWMPA
jgi:hypothetical protein